MKKLQKKKSAKINTVHVEDLIVETILTFCENAAELGCPREQEVDMWFRYLPYKKQFKVAQKMVEIVERYEKERTGNTKPKTA